jgi:hypothetical protein
MRRWAKRVAASRATFIRVEPSSMSVASIDVDRSMTMAIPFPRIDTSSMISTR